MADAREPGVCVDDEEYREKHEALHVLVRVARDAREYYDLENHAEFCLFALVAIDRRQFELTPKPRPIDWCHLDAELLNARLRHTFSNKQTTPDVTVRSQSSALNRTRNR